MYTVPQSGTYVSRINLYSAENARFVREQLEQQIMIECCSKLDNQTRIVLETILEEQEKAAKIKDERAFFRADNLFHEGSKWVLWSSNQFQTSFLPAISKQAS